MKKLFIISLPRHGTTSAETFLHSHGLMLAHNGKITGDAVSDHWHPGRMKEIHRKMKDGDFSIDIIDKGSCSGMSGYPASSHYRQLASQFPEAVFLHITRDKTDWLKSAPDFLRKTSNTREGDPELQAAFHFFRAGAFGGNPMSREEFAAAYDRHYSDVREFGKEIGGKRFLELDLKQLITKDDLSLNKLCDFAGIQRNQDIEFPHANEHTLKYAR